MRGFGGKWWSILKHGGPQKTLHEEQQRTHALTHVGIKRDLHCLRVARGAGADCKGMRARVRMSSVRFV